MFDWPFLPAHIRIKAVNDAFTLGDAWPGRRPRPQHPRDGVRGKAGEEFGSTRFGNTGA